MDKIKKLSSRRNSVFLLENKDSIEVVKNFFDAEFYHRELMIYKILKTEFNREINNSVYMIPILKDFNDLKLSIRYDYIYGQTVLNRFEEYERKNDIMAGITLMKLLFEWIDKFHKRVTREENMESLSSVNIHLDRNIIAENKMVVSLIDINFRNFIITDEALYGFDFENSALDKKIKDYSRALAYMMLYNPVRSSYKENLLPHLLIELEDMTGFANDEICEAYNEELKKVEERRKHKK